MGFEIRQVIGVAYTYRSSRPVRHRLAAERTDHSSHHRDFTYFKKANNSEDIVENGKVLRLTKHPITGQSVRHWSEPEVAIFLGDQQRIVGYALSNDFTASGIELAHLGEGYDPTYYGKCWKGSCSLGKVFSPAGIIDDGNLGIGIKIERYGNTIYNAAYHTNSRLRTFAELPGLVVAYYLELLAKFGSFALLPKSKRIEVNGDGLPSGTVVLTGTGIVKTGEKYAAIEGDTVTISSPQLGGLRNGIG